MNSSLKETLALLKRDAWVKPYLGHYRKILALALVLGCCTVLFAAGLMFTSGWLIAGSAEMPYSVLMLGYALALRAGIRRGKTCSALLRTPGKSRLGIAIHLEPSQATIPVF